MISNDNTNQNVSLDLAKENKVGVISEKTNETNNTPFYDTTRADDDIIGIKNREPLIFDSRQEENDDMILSQRKDDKTKIVDE